MTKFELLENIYLWFSRDIIGHEVIAGFLVFTGLFTILAYIGIPKKVTIAFMIPLALGYIYQGYLSWFGWLIIGFAGLIFGTLIYQFYEN